jgi:hypothetical protein
MPWWGWVLIVVAVVAFVPIKTALTKRFLARMKARRESADLDE